jgi:rsbT co-antagonist protein RsbR
MTDTADAPTTRELVCDFLDRRRDDIVADWSKADFFRIAGPSGDEIVNDCAEVLGGVRRAIDAGEQEDPSTDSYIALRGLLASFTTPSGDERSVSRIAVRMSRLKDPVIQLWQEEAPAPEHLVAGAVLINTAIATLRLVLLDVELRTLLDTVTSQREQLTELSTPVIKLWDGILAIPLIGTLDSMRSQVATESLLQAIMDHQARVAILDITGVPTVDTMVAQHLLKTAMAARLMGADCVISGIRPQIAHTMVQLGIDLGEVATRARLADALAYAMAQVGLSVGTPGATAGTVTPSTGATGDGQHPDRPSHLA